MLAVSTEGKKKVVFYCPLVRGDRKKQYSCNPMGEEMGRGQEEQELSCLLLNTKLEM